MTTARRRLGSSAALMVVVSWVFLAQPSAAAHADGPERCRPSPGRTLVVATIPQMPGFEFMVGGRHYRTGSSGKVRIASVTCPEPEHAVAPLTETIERDERTTATFDGWYSTELLGRERGDGTVWAAFRQRVEVDIALTDLADRPVARAAVGEIVMKSSTGALVGVPRGKSSVWLDASRVVRFSNGLVSKDIRWSLQSVDAGGNTAVNRGQVRFEPRRRHTVTVPLMLYELRVVVRDVILHRPVGEEVSLVSPDGTRSSIPLDDRAEGARHELARGHYVLRADGSPIAISFEQPVAISRGQRADLTVVSYWDLLIVGFTVVSVVAGLLLVGWRIHVRSRRRTAPATAPADEEAPVASPVLVRDARVGGRRFT